MFAPSHFMLKPYGSFNGVDWTQELTFTYLLLKCTLIYLFKEFTYCIHYERRTNRSNTSCSCRCSYSDVSVINIKNQESV